VCDCKVTATPASIEVAFLGLYEAGRGELSNDGDIVFLISGLKDNNACFVEFALEAMQ
jgi:hypothetical protein